MASDIRVKVTRYLEADLIAVGGQQICGPPLSIVYIEVTVKRPRVRPRRITA